MIRLLLVCMTRTMHVARLQPSDATHYRNLMLEAYELAADAFISTAEERASEPESFWVNRIANTTGMSAVFGAFEGQELVGTVTLEFSAKPKTRHKAVVIGMYVAPAARGAGASRTPRGRHQVGQGQGGHSSAHSYGR